MTCAKHTWSAWTNETTALPLGVCVEKLVRRCLMPGCTAMEEA